MEIAPHGARLARVLLAVLATVGALAVANPASSPVVAAPAATSDFASGTYVVLLAQAPAASYRGGVRDLAATAPRKGTTYDASRPAARTYTRYLRAQQDRVARSVGVRPFYHYTTSLNGFAVALTAAQARSLSTNDGVLAVVPDRVRHTQSWQSSELAGPLPRRTAAPSGPTGTDVVIGVVDTGIDSGSPSFAPLGRRVPGTYTGDCQAGSDNDESAAYGCSDKVVGGRWFARGQGGAQAVWSDEYLSPADYAGHGTRTASTAAGDARRQVKAGGIALGGVTGAAPDARVASYKVCWAAEGGTDSCMTSDALAGIDQAVADGVDVLSYGVAGAPADVVDPVELAFMHAADAGVFVATAAGNGGRGASPGHPSPWTTTVGAASNDAHVATVVLGNGERYVGASVTPRDVASAPLVLARDAAAEGSSGTDAQLCFPGSLDPAAVAGAIVVCDRGTNDRVEKSAVVDVAGGVGMVLLNPTVDSVNPDLHAVPTVHLPETAYDGVYSYAESADVATATIRADIGRMLPQPPALASFSARGPSLVAGGDLLKPDLVAPGVGVLTAVASAGGAEAAGRGYGLSSGTSVSAAYVAGLAARLQQAHPDWSPMAVKSALMTTASDLTDTDDPFDQGAGFVRPQQALDPGLVVDSGISDWSSYLAGQGYGEWFGADPVRAANVNVPSVVISDLAGRQVVQRTVTNVGRRTATYSVSAHGIEGISVTAVPSVFSLAPGERQRLRLRFVRDNADLGTYQTGVVRLNDGPGGHLVRLPLALRPVGVQAPERVRLDSNGRSFSTRSGITGTLVARVRGLVAGVDTAADGSDTQGADFEPGMRGLWSQTVDVAGPGVWLRVQALAEDHADDLDLFLLDDQGRVVDSATTAAATETLTAHGLDAGTYTIDVQPWFVAEPSGHTTFTVRTFQVPFGASGSLRVEPRRQGVSPGVANSWSLAPTGEARPGTSWFGWIGWYAGDDMVGRTLVSSD